MSQKEDHEDAALAALSAEWQLRGHQVEFLGNPDRDKDAWAGLTVDAVFRVDGAEFAVDHCLLSREEQLPKAIQHGENVLTRLLKPLAEEACCVLEVTFRPHAGAYGTKWGDGYYEQFVALARQAIASGMMEHLGDGYSFVRAVPPPPPLSPNVEFTHFPNITGSPLVSVQASAGLKPPILKKLNKQLRKAKDLGYTTVLLLDQVPRPDANNDTSWMAHPQTVAFVVNEILAEHQLDNPPALDQVWLRRISGNATRHQAVVRLIPPEAD